MRQLQRPFAKSRRRTVRPGKWALVLGLLFVTVQIFSCTSDAGASGDAWSVGEQDGGDTVDDTVSNGDDSADDTISYSDGGHGEIVCGEPGQVITTVEAAAELAPCDVYRGSFNFNLVGTDYTSLEMLPDLRIVEGTIEIDGRGPLKTLEGLDRLERVGALKLSGFGELEDFSGLSSLQRVDGMCKLAFIVITDFTGLENLRSTGDFHIRLSELESMEGLNGLRHVRGDFWLYSEGDIQQGEVDSFLEEVDVSGEVSVVIE